MDKDVTIYGDGKQVRDVLWIDDLTELFGAAYDQIDKASGEVYNIGGGHHLMSLWDLVALLDEILEKRQAPAMSDWRPGDQRVYVSDISKAERELGWRPRVAPAEGVRRLVDWAIESKELLLAILG
jgi:CDP-paratose 2-epimerase